MKILALFGSPRRDGNTEILLDSVLQGATDNGAICNKISLFDYKISSCLELYGCQADGRCVIKDDMNKIYPMLCESNSIILASPIFFYHVPAPIKAMIDRCQALWVKKYKLHLPISTIPNRKGIFIGVGATKGDNLFVGVKLTVKYFFDAIDVSYSKELLVRKIDEKGEIRKHPDLLEQAYELGKDITK